MSPIYGSLEATYYTRTMVDKLPKMSLVTQNRALIEVFDNNENRGCIFLIDPDPIFDMSRLFWYVHSTVFEMWWSNSQK